MNGGASARCFPLRRALLGIRSASRQLFSAVNYALGGLDVRGYHAWNIAVHILCALIIFGVVRRTLEWPALHSTFGSSATSLAFSTALLWELHPLNSEATDYVIQRTESMMALFCLLTLYASIRAIESRATVWWHRTAVTSCALGMACKESMAFAPLLVVAFDEHLCIRSGQRDKTRRRQSLAFVPGLRCPGAG